MSQSSTPIFAALNARLLGGRTYLRIRTGKRVRTAQKWFHKEGLYGLVRYCAHYFLMFHKLKKRDREFDKRFGVDTKGPVSLWHLRVPVGNIRDAARYEGSDPNLIAQLLQDLHQDLSSFTFVDLGCGKGRVLLVAARFGFSQLVGVEFATQLADIATRNCRRLGLPARILNKDATQFDFPVGNLVVYLFNPFGPSVLGPVLNRLLKAPISECFLIYVNPQHRFLIDVCPRMQPLSHIRGAAVWKLLPPPQPHRDPASNTSASVGGAALC